MTFQYLYSTELTFVGDSWKNTNFFSNGLKEACLVNIEQIIKTT